MTSFDEEGKERIFKRLTLKVNDHYIIKTWQKQIKQLQLLKLLLKKEL